MAQQLTVDNTTERRSPVDRKKLFLQSAAGMALISVVLSACGNRAQAEAQAIDRPSTTNSSPDHTGGESTPSTSESPSPTDLPTVTSTESPTSSPEATPTSPEVTFNMDKMTPEQFAKLPVEVRTDYILSKYFILSEDGSLFDHVDQKLTNGKSLYDYNPYQTPLDADAEGDQILLAYMYAEQVSRAWKPDITVAGGGANDPVTAKKLVAGMAYDSNSKVYKSNLDSIENSTQVGRLRDEDINGSLVINTTQAKETEQKDGAMLKERTLTVVSGGNTYAETFVFVPKDEALGAGNGLWLLTSRTKVKK